MLTALHAGSASGVFVNASTSLQKSKVKESSKGVDVEGVSVCLVLAVTASETVRMGLEEPVFIYRACVSSDASPFSL